MSIIIFLLILYSPADVLVLKNGKTITCRSYKVNNDQVIIKGKKETFVLPEKMIDWDRSKTEKDRRDQLALIREKEAEEARLKAEALAQVEEEERQKKVVKLTSDDYKQKYGSRGSGKTTVAYETLGNSILVKASINGQGPFDILLDTGASITLISPSLAKKLGILHDGDSRNLVGVGGAVVSAKTATLHTINLGNAQVRDLKVTLRSISQLNNYDVVGLLGQDFLNHFRMELNPASKTVTLTPNGMGQSIQQNLEDLEAFLRYPDKAFNQLRAMTGELSNYFVQFQRMPSGSANSGDMRRVRELAHKAPEISREMDRTWTHLANIPEDKNRPEVQDRIRVLLSCKSDMKNYMRELSQFASTLRTAYSSASNENTMNRYKADLEERRNKVNRALLSYLECSNK